MRFVLALIIMTYAKAEALPIVSMDSLLEQPMAHRLAQFKAQGFKGQEFLKRAAFDSSNSLQIRWRAITTMGRWDALRFRPELDKALASKEWFMRNAALIALQNDERSRAIAWSVKALDDTALVVRTQAVRNLIELNAIETEPRLWKEMFAKKNFRGAESLWIRQHIAEALARFNQPNRTANFRKLLMDEDSRVYRWAIKGLENNTGMKMTASGESIEVRRQKWLSRLGSGAI
jgi:HEAT repeat protein